ncbi:MAG: Rpn family recombination-promoting nuclease/putative transposase, partial [Bacteroidota bacterium]
MKKSGPEGTKHNPKFDAFVSRSMSYKSIAEAFLAKLPGHLLEHLDVNNFKQNESLDTNEELVVHRKDKTLQVTMQDGSVLIVHIEHQSTPEFMMLIRFLY